MNWFTPSAWKIRQEVRVALGFHRQRTLDSDSAVDSRLRPLEARRLSWVGAECFLSCLKKRGSAFIPPTRLPSAIDGVGPLPRPARAAWSCRRRQEAHRLRCRTGSACSRGSTCNVGLDINGLFRVTAPNPSATADQVPNLLDRPGATVRETCLRIQAETGHSAAAQRWCRRTSPRRERPRPARLAASRCKLRVFSSHRASLIRG